MKRLFCKLIEALSVIAMGLSLYELYKSYKYAREMDEMTLKKEQELHST